ncbi:hypothetical protein BLNAU_20296 [Blattamonas nauphoetae]|uniref:Uncharacterized protein n=1 Tax=Blattamonas nauphoetae TaxID=2049346 RepID=A0ABQ9WZN8_9EUKA|nr:hypothetical protein BLNAU_20296 [Blattamonas nauphoetae]
MDEQTGTSNLTNKTFLLHSPESRSTIKPEEEPFLTFNPNSKLSFKDKTTVYRSLVALVKAEYPFDDALQDQAARFLKDLEPEHGEEKEADRRVIDLVPSPIGSPSGFMESPYHRPTLDFVLRSRIMMAYSSCHSFVERDNHIWCLFGHIFNLLTQWDDEGPEEVLSVKQIVNAHISEGFEDTLEQMMKHDNDGPFGVPVVASCHSISKYMGSNVRLSQMTPTHFCGSSSDIGNAVVAGVDEQILGSPPIVQKCASICTSQQLSAILEPKEASKEPKCGQPSRSFAFARASGMDRTQLVQHSGNRPTILLLSVQTEQLSFPHFLPRSEVSFVVNGYRNPVGWTGTV